MRHILAGLAALALLVPAPAPAEDDFELGVLAALNAARTHPQAYVQSLEIYRGYYRGDLVQEPGRQILLRTKEGISAVDEAIGFMRRQPPLPPLSPNAPLERAARDHVEDQGSRGLVGHGGSDGSGPEQRIGRYSVWHRAIAEDIAYDDATPAGVVMELIIDDGVADRGHRTNIFDPHMRLAGIACGPHRVYGRMCVIDFAAAISPKP
ncbi:MAG TPA: CAP domain-containing protein [Stellaceae bacterium]|jgi:uncharacterized protein YkwD|nr:CAP domain-containing protein [Stellaceae bacterium]